MRKIFLLIVCAMFFNSCALYKKYERSEVKTDGLYRDAESKNDTASIGNMSWRELFTDAQLQVLIEKGLSSNTDLRIAYLKVEEAKASFKSAQLAYVPSLALNLQGSAAKDYKVDVAASWEVDVFGKLTNAKRGAKAVVEQSDAYRQAVQTQLIATIASSYYSLLMLDRQLEISIQTELNWRDNVAAMRALKFAGLTNEAAISQAEANRLSVEASVLTLKKQINDIENSLSTLIGNSAQSIERSKLSEQTFIEKLSVGVPLNMLSNRPDVRQAEFALASSFYMTNQMRSAFYPNITLSGLIGWTNSGGVVSSPAELIKQAVGSLVQPIFNKGINKARLKIAKAQQEAAELTFKQSLLDAGAEVNNALTGWQTARSRTEINLEKIKNLQTAVRSTQLMMRHSSTTYLEVLVAEQTLLQAELVLVSDRYDEIQSVINLYHALGGGR